MAVYTINVRCKCIRTCEDMNLIEGRHYFCDIKLTKTGAPVFIIRVDDGGPVKCVQEWFENYCELVN